MHIKIIDSISFFLRRNIQLLAKISLQNKTKQKNKIDIHYK